MITNRKIKIITCLIVLCFLFTLILATNKETKMVDNIVYDLSMAEGADLVYQLTPQNTKFGNLRSTPNDGTSRIENIDSPQLTVYKVNSAKKVPVVIICPGGGYGYVTFNKEGTPIAKWLQKQNIASVILSYRNPSRREDAFADIAAAVKAIKENADAWNMDANMIGGIGFSAGGHLVARATTSGYLNFGLFIYPAYLNKEDEVAPELRTLDFEKLPPIFIAHSDDDTLYVPGSKIFNRDALKYNPKSEFHCYATGGHGYGLYSTGEAIAWVEAAEKWLKTIL
jgi:acetyl esterase/lipase